MLEESILLELNPQLGMLNGIFQDTSNLFRDSTVSNYMQISVEDIFRTVSDKSLFSHQIERKLVTNELKSSLSHKNFNFLQAISIEGLNHVLDLSEDFGGVAHYLSSSVGAVDSVKVDSDRTRLSALRCTNKQNICHISENIDRLIFPVSHYDLIVVGQLEMLSLDKHQQQRLLEKLQKSLSPTGTLIINVINRDRVIRWLDAKPQISPDNLPFQELYSTKFPQEYARKELLDTLANCDFSAINFNATFSQGTEIQNLFSEDYLTSNLNAINHFYRLNSISNEQLNEYLFYRSQDANKVRLFEFASRFIVFASNKSQYNRKLYDNDFCHFSGTSRKPQWRANTSRGRGSKSVTKKRSHLLNTPINSDDCLLRQNLADQPFARGKLLIDLWITAIVENQYREFRDLINEYWKWLNELAQKEDFREYGYDLLPFNIVLNEKKGIRDYQIIDKEWEYNATLKPEFVLFRALFWFAFENRTALKGYCKKFNIANIASFVIKYMPNIGQLTELMPYVALEEDIQKQIAQNFRNKSVEHALFHSFQSFEIPNDAKPITQITLGNTEGMMAEDHAVFVSWEGTGNVSNLVFDLPSLSDAHNVIRIDPIQFKSSFKIHALTFCDDNREPICHLDSTQDLESIATLENCLKLESQGSEQLFLALNDDPHFMINLLKRPELAATKTIKLDISMQSADWHDPAMTALSNAVNEQSNALVRQTNSLDEYRAELEFTNLRLENVIEHRKDLNDINNAHLRDIEYRKHLLNEANLKLVHLNEQLLAQLGRNEEMEGYLMMRPSTRLKRFVSRNLNRLRGKSEPNSSLASETFGAPRNGETVDDGQTSNSEIREDENQVPTSGELIGQNTENYQQWIQENSLSATQIEQAKLEIQSMQRKPTFSIVVPVYNVDAEYLIAMIRSVQAQIYPHWQLCIVDDASPKSYLRQILKHEAENDDRISIQLNTVNQGISLATNDAISLATGDFIGLLDHDDEISIDALFHNARAINRHDDAGLLYSDEDKMDLQGERLEPYFKPDYSPDLLDTNNYICHFTTIKKSIIDEIGGFREGLDGSQDHDIILRAIARVKQEKLRVIHIPRILYHWRKIPGSTAVAYDSKSYAWEAGRKAVEACLNQDETGVRVEFGSLKGTYRVLREIKGEPLVSIVIPFKDKPELLDSCLNSILDRSSYKNFEIIGISNNSVQELTHERMSHFAEHDSRIRFIEKNIPFNFSALCNFGAAQADGEYLLFLNNDIEIISPDWIERLLEHAQRPQNGAVGGKLLYPDGRIQHAGVVAGMVGAAGHPHKFFPDNHIGYHGRLHMVYNVSAVTGAMMMVAKDKFIQAGQFNEDNLAVAYNDIDLCLSLLDHGYLNVFTPHCKATHHESISRGYEDTQEKLDRLKSEQEFFLGKWREFLDQGDPYYNPNLSLKNERFSLKFND